VSVAEGVTWIKVEHPSFDLAGVLISSLQITGGLLVIALLMGTLFGLTLLWRRRGQGSHLDPVSLRLSGPLLNRR
jgi:hypothetical protein